MDRVSIYKSEEEILDILNSLDAWKEGGIHRNYAVQEISNITGYNKEKVESIIKILADEGKITYTGSSFLESFIKTNE